MTQPDSSDNSGSANAPLRKPAWLRRPLASDRRFFITSALLNEQGENAWKIGYIKSSDAEQRVVIE